MAQPFVPMLADVASISDATRVAESDDWAFEPKCDGHRRCVLKVGTAVTGYSRKGEPAALPAAVVAEVARLDVDLVLDGELIGDVWVCFDLLAFGDLTLHGLPWVKRRAALEGLFEKWQPGAAVRLITAARTLDEKTELLARVKAQHAEGIVAKDVHSGYHPGKRSDRWLKLKLTHTIDCVVLSLGTEKQNLQLGVYRDGQLVEIGEVSRLTGDGPRVEVDDVVEVTVLYVSPDWRLVQPVSPRLRTMEKAAVECTWDQLPALVPLSPVI